MPEAAQEIVPQIFLRLWEYRARWVVRDTVRTYPYGATRNRALGWLKHQRVEDRWRERVAWADADRIPGIGRPMLRDFAEALDRAIRNLPERYRAVVELRHGGRSRRKHRLVDTTLSSPGPAAGKRQFLARVRPPLATARKTDHH